MAKTAITPKELIDETAYLYPGNSSSYPTTAQILLLYYDDDAVALTKQLLGITDRTPLTNNIMKRVVDTISVVYDKPVARHLILDSFIIPDEDPEIMLFEDILKESSYDAHFKRVDSYRTLLGTVIRRTYAVGVHQKLAYRTFMPICVYRRPTPGFEDDITMDEAIALKLNEDVYELWQMTPEGWTMFITTGDGEVLRSPFGEEGLSPYDELPIQLIHDQTPEGRAFMPLKLSRISFQENINRVSNGVLEMVEMQAFDQMVHTKGSLSVDGELKDDLETGPSVVTTLPVGDTLDAIQRTPMITPSLDAATRFIESWLISENIPIDYFKGSTALQTGAALRAQLWPLQEKRDAMLPLVVIEQTQAFEIIRSVWNVHAPSWNKEPLSEETDIKIYVVPIPIPIDEDKLRDIASWELSEGLLSHIQYLQRKNQITRSAAVELYKQTQNDLSQYQPTELSAEHQPEEASETDMAGLEDDLA